MPILRRVEQYIRFYSDVLRLNTCPSISKKPIHSWSIYTDRKFDTDELIRIYRESLGDRGRLNIAVITGKYISSYGDTYPFVVDIDKIDMEERIYIANELKDRGYLVAYTKKGLHIHGFLDKQVYIIALQKDGIHAGEGASIMNHLWLSPPSRILDVRYRFVDDEVYMPEVKTLDRLKKDLSIAGYTASYIRYDRERFENIPIEPRTGEGAKLKRPLFKSFDEFIGMIYTTPDYHPIPLCVAEVLYYYLKNVGRQYEALTVLYGLEDGHGLRRHVDVEHIRMKSFVEKGRRLLSIYATVNFLTTYIQDIDIEKLDEIFRHSIEDYPNDEGGDLRRKMLNLIMMDDKGNIYPRYRDSTAFTQSEVICSRCVYSRTCRNHRITKTYYRHLRYTSENIQPA